VNLIIGPETLLVIDDVERCDMGIRELLGAVDHLVVGCRKKVLLVCNEDEWRKGLGPKGEKGTTREYESLIEKTVWRKCRFRPSVGSVVERVLGGVLGGVSVNIIFTISTNAFSPIAPTRIRRIRQRGCAAFGA